MCEQDTCRKVFLLLHVCTDKVLQRMSGVSTPHTIYLL